MPTLFVGGGVKGPSEELDFTVDWSAWLATTGDLIVDCDVTTTGLTITKSLFTDVDTTVFVEGGVPGNSYTVTFTVYLTSGRVASRSIKITVRDR